MTEAITIAGHVFNAPVRYEEGHELTANEAAALNQTYHENLRNNFAKKVKDAANGADLSAEALTALQVEFDAYAQAYAFGTRVAGVRASKDPVMAEAMNIAKGQIRAALRAKGRKVSDVEASALTEAAKKLIDRDEKILELARERVAQAQAAASEDLSSLIADIPTKPAEAPAAQG